MADRYWVGGAGTWDATTTTNWSASSGGAGGASAPTSADNVIFDSASNATLYTVTVGTNAVAQDITIAGPAAGNVTITSAATSVINCYGSWLSAATGVVFTTTSGAALNFLATTTGKTVTTNNVTLGTMTVTFSNSSGGWTLGSDITTTGSFNVTSGTFNTGANYAINASGFASAGGTFKSITLNSSTLTVTATGGFQIATTATNLTFSGASSTIICSNGSPTFGGISGLTYGTVNFTSATLATVTITGANTYTNLTFTSRTTDGLGAISFSEDQTVTGTLTVGTANTAVRRLWLRSSAVGTQRTFTVAAVATLADVDFRDIVAAGAAGTLSGTRLGNCRNNSNITFGAGATKYWSTVLGVSANWSGTSWATSTGGVPAINNFPLAQDTCIVDDSGATVGNGLRTSNTITIDANWNIGTLDLSGRTVAFNWTQGNLDPLFYGDVTLTTAMTMTTVTGSPSWTFCGQGAIQTLNSAGLIIRLNALNVDSPGWGLTLAVNTEVDLSPIALPFNNGTFVFTAGTLDFANKNLSAISFSMGTGANTLVFGSTGTLTATATVAATVFTGSTTTTVSGTPLVIVNGNTSAARTITPGVVTEANSISFNITAGTGTVTLSTSNFFKNVNYTGFTGIWGSGSPVLFGNLTLDPSMSVTAGGTVFFQSTSGTKTITTNAVVVDKSFTFDGVGGSWQLQDALTSGATRTCTLTAGTLDLGNQTLTTGLFSSNNTNTRTLAFGSGAIYVNGIGNSTVYTASDSTNYTISGSKNVYVTGVGILGNTRTVAGGLLTSNGSSANALNFYISAGADTISLGTANRVFNTIDFTGFSGSTLTNIVPYIYGNLVLSSGMTLTAGTNAWTFAATTAQTITTAGLTFDFPVTFDGIGGTFVLVGDLTLGSTKTLTFANGTIFPDQNNNSTITAGSFVTTGTNQKLIANIVYPTYTSALSVASGTVSVSYLNIEGINAIGGAVFQAFLSNFNNDLGNNTGWNFSQFGNKYIYTRRKLKRIIF
jgi:hypothetical protein